MENQMSSKNFIFTKYASIVLYVFVIIDSIVCLVNSSADHNEDKLNNTSIIATMTVRIVITLIAIFITYKGFSLNHRLTTAITSIYALIMLIILFLSAYVFDFRTQVITLVVQIVSTFVAFAVTFNFLVIQFILKDSKTISANLDDKSAENRSSETKGKNHRTKKFTIEKLLIIINDNILAISTLSAVILAIVLGIAIKRWHYQNWNQRSIMYVELVGELFLRGLKCLILPLIFTSIVDAMANIDLKLSGKIGARVFLYYFVTYVLTTILVIAMVLTIKPGQKTNKSNDVIDHSSGRNVLSEDSVLDLLRNLFPENIIDACLKSYRTVLKPPVNSSENETDIHDWDIETESVDGTNILGIAAFAIVFGVVIGRLEDRNERQLLINFFKAFSNTIMDITSIFIKFSPIGVLFLVLSQILAVTQISEMIAKVGWYALTVIICCAIHGLITIPLIYFAVIRKNPFSFMIKVFESILTAFGTASTSATVPVTLHCLEERCGIDKRISRFSVPLGATVNLDGQTVYFAVATVFIAQYRGWQLSLAQVIIMSITSTVVSVGAAGLPQAGPVFLIIILNAVGLPAQDAALIYLADWFLDRLATALNVLGDAFAAAVIHHLSREDLKISK